MTHTGSLFYLKSINGENGVIRSNFKAWIDGDLIDWSIYFVSVPYAYFVAKDHQVNLLLGGKSL